MRNGRYAMSSSELSHNDETNINGQKYRTHLHEIDGMFGNNMMMEDRSDQCTENGSDGGAIRNDGKTTKRNTLCLQSLIAFCNEVSVVGLSYVANMSASAFRRSVWALLLLVGVAFTVYQIQNQIRHYLSHPVNVVIREEYMEEMTFPTVTVCNENRMSLSNATSLGMCPYCDFFKS